jgi:phosphate transport system permease protein
MTDRTASFVDTAEDSVRSIHTSDAARERLRKRYRSERIFKRLGLAAILVSVGFLALLLSTVVWKGIPAFTYNFASIPFDFSGVDDSSAEALAKADFDAVVRESLRAEFPEVTERTERRLLGTLLSTGASVLLREQVLARPGDMAKPAAYEVPISDFADLYLKGQITASAWEPGGTGAAFAANADTVTITAPTPRFAPLLETIHLRIEAEAVATRGRLAGALRSEESNKAALDALTTRLAAGPSAEDRAWIEPEIARLTTVVEALATQLTELETAAQALEARSASAVDGESLTPGDPSLLIYTTGGVIKVEAMTPTGATGMVIEPFDATPPSNITDWRMRVLDQPESNRKFSDQEIVWTDVLVERGYVKSAFNWIFATKGASREPELAGVWGALVGSILTLIVTISISFPLGVAAAVYLEEFAAKNRWTTIIEVNINNLAAVPSIVFGLLGLAVFLNFFGFERSAPYVGGLVLALMTLPIIIIASRAALRAVPPSIREAALGIGASKLQMVTHHVLPLAMPGIMTGTILGMAHALGETAPLLMIGMVAFVVDIPTSFSSPATLLPVQIFMWADFPEPAFEQRTSAAILVLLGFLVAMNAVAIILRKQFERRW